MIIGASIANFAFLTFPIPAMTLENSFFYGCNVGKFDRKKQPLVSVSSTKPIAANTDTVMIVIKPRVQINSFTNNSETYLDQLYVTTDGTKTTSLKIIKNPDTIGAGIVGDFPNYSYFNEESSLLLIDTNAVSYTGGTIIATITLGKVDSTVLDLTDLEIFVQRTDTLIVTALSTSTADVSVSLNLTEDY